MSAIQYDVVKIESSLDLLGDYLDMRSFQEVSIGGHPAVVLASEVGDTELADAMNAAPGKMVHATGQLLMLTIPRGMTRIRSLVNRVDWITGQADDLTPLSKSSQTVRVQLIDRAELTTPEVAYANYRPVINHYCDREADKHTGSIKWNREGKPCSKPIAIGRTNKEYLCTRWDWYETYGTDPTSGESFRELMRRLFPATEPVYLVGMMIPNRSVIWMPVPEGKFEEVHRELEGYGPESFFTLEQIVYLDGPDIIISSEVVSRAVLENLA
ncbi:hypothetical protein [Lewinella sp. IMCC34191]|uniref:hypothetical protein n=1 Tax=Lewinella sp. IMCC34191 TaxID=2259172 RepID=UPI000E24B149|nr:hypothetical protein [Lewinella sp. IMCC34191]